MKINNDLVVKYIKIEEPATIVSDYVGIAESNEDVVACEIASAKLTELIKTIDFGFLSKKVYENYRLELLINEQLYKDNIINNDTYTRVTNSILRDMKLYEPYREKFNK